MKNDLTHGVLAGLLAGIASVLFLNVYSSNLEVDFSAVAKPVMIIISSIIGTVLASVGYFLYKKIKWFSRQADLIFNIVFFILSFLSIYGTFSAPLPPNTLKPELFSGLTIPMHFFPMLFWLVVKPHFASKKIQN
ncbi:hypothetical protein E9993_21270 [Labilibacter sediminis]|nr:hypothetical protein E9993_21270 [Labilibacter sediminis]